MNASDNYPAIRTIKPERYAGQVRNVYTGVIRECGHSHRSRSAAIQCADNLTAKES